MKLRRIVSMKIYKIVNLINGKCYIGQTKQKISKRFANHISNAKKKVNRYLYDAMNHYGYENFSIELIEDGIIKEKIDETEIKWIAELKTLDPTFGYNMTKGGGGGHTLANWSEDRKKEHYRHQAENRAWSYPRGEETRKKIGDAHRGKIIPQEMRDRISETNKRKGIKWPNPTVTCPNCGKAGGQSAMKRWHFDNCKILTKIGDVESIKEMIKKQWKLIEISEHFKTTTRTIQNELSKTGKTFQDWRNEFGIKGAFGSVQRLDASG